MNNCFRQVHRNIAAMDTTVKNKDIILSFINYLEITFGIV